MAANKRLLFIFTVLLFLITGPLYAQYLAVNVKADPALKIFVNGNLDFSKYYGVIVAGLGTLSIPKENGTVIKVKGNAKKGKFGQCIEAELVLENNMQIYLRNGKARIPLTVGWAYKDGNNIVDISSKTVSPIIPLYPEGNSAWWSAYLYIHGKLENYDSSIPPGHYRGNILVKIEQRTCNY